MPDVQDFLTRVVPWPPQEDPGYVHLIWSQPSRHDPKKKFWNGKGTRSIKDLLDTVQWVNGTPSVDFYFCLSQQRDVKLSPKNFPKAVRSRDGAMSLRSIFLDVDVKAPPKGYASLPEALGAVAAFVQAKGLPAPNALVASGGGLHVYWISRTPLTPAQWQPYANGLRAAAIEFGLRFDAGVTVDSARVLRVPGTKNWKTDPPRPVRLLQLATPEKDYDFTTALQMLPPLAALAPARTTSPATPFDLSAFPKREFQPGEITDSLSAGLEHEPLPPLPWQPLINKCAFVTEALVTGGKDYSQPMWNLSTLLATFLENGHGLAHRMGNRHSGYDRASTDALWDRKSREREDRGIGWPSCGAIQAAGCGHCAVCPRLKLGKSPLNIALEAQSLSANGVSASVPPAAPSVTATVTRPDPTAAELFLPDGFIVHEGCICKLVKLKADDDEAPQQVPLKLFYNKIWTPWASQAPAALHFLASFDKGGMPRSITVMMAEMATTHGLNHALLRQGAKPAPANERYLRDFMVSWIGKLHAAQAASTSTPFGWLMDGVTKKGFVYGGLVMNDDGTEHPSGTTDPTLRELYAPTGTLQPWYDACKLITDQKRPELDIIVASAFAAPLMQVTGEYIGLLSAWGAGGAGKSTAVKVAQAVWAHPKKTKEVTLSTTRSVVDKMGKLRHLPMYWDEIKDAKNQSKVFDVVFGTEGVGPSRLTHNIEHRERADWQTMLVICSNISFNDFVISEQPTHTAGLMRVLEYYIPDALPGAPGIINTIDASNITQALEANYGVMGLKYGKYLADNAQTIDTFTKKTVNDFVLKVKGGKTERFWQAICGTLLAGAAVANALGCQLDIPAMYDFLVKTYANNRRRVDEGNTDSSKETNIEEILTVFLKLYVAHTVYTERLVLTRGKPRATVLIHGPKLDSPRPIHVQWAVSDHTLLIARTEFLTHLKRCRIAAEPIMVGLRKFFVMQIEQRTLAAGTPYRAGREQIMVLKYAPGSALEELSHAHASSENAAPVPSPIDAPIVTPEAAAAADAALKLVQANE